MAMKDFDAKKFLLERGERVGLGIALFLMALLILLNLFMPSHGFFSGKPSTKAAELEKPTQAVYAALRDKQPGASDLPDENKKDNVLFQFPYVDPAKFRMLPLFPYESGEMSQRRPPELLAMDEAHTAVARVQVPTYMATFDKDGQPYQVMVLVDAPDKAGGGKGANPLKALQGARGRGSILPSMPGMPPGGGGGSGAMAGMYGNRQQQLMQRAQAKRGTYSLGGGDDAPKEMKAELLPISKVNSGARLAEQVQPMRMAIIAGSFPYKAQLEEFKDKLHKDSVADVLREQSLEKGKGGTALPAFRFLGVRVQRQTLAADGKTVLVPWQEIDVNATYKPYYFLTGKRFEPDDPKWKPISFPGLVMPRLPQMGGDHKAAPVATGPKTTPAGAPAKGKEAPAKGVKENQYPTVEDDVVKLEPVLKELSGKDAPKVVAPTLIQGAELDVFDTGGQQKEADGTETSTTSTTSEAVKDADIPAHCLVRVIDLTIEPGRVYQYRLKVRMANPNYRHKDVASPAYSAGKELAKDDDKKWYVVPELVVVPPELIYYAVDQAQLDTDRAQKIYWRKVLGYERIADRERSAVLQAHRWLESVPYQKREELLIGEWAVAERYRTFRGEPVGRRVVAKFPLWRYTLADFVIASHTDTRSRKQRPGYEVNFGPDRPDGLEPLLVDFESGQFRHDRPGSKYVSDVMAEEVLILSPDGKLLGRDGALDAQDPDREERLTKVRDRIKAIEEKTQPKKENKRPGFDKP